MVLPFPIFFTAAWITRFHCWLAVYCDLCAGVLFFGGIATTSVCAVQLEGERLRCKHYFQALNCHFLH